MSTTVHFLQTAVGEKIAYARYLAAQTDAISIFYVPGYGAHKFSQKALHLLEYAKAHHLNWVSFDHLGCGESSGQMSQMGLADYLEAAQLVLDAISPTRCLIVGSSFGGWLSALLAEKNPCICAFMGIAGAYDFTRFIYSKMDPIHHEEIALHQRLILRLKTSDEEFVFSKKLLYQSQEWFVLNRDIQLNIPVCLLHGTADPDVPWQNSLNFMEKITSREAKLVLLKDIGHRLIEPIALNALSQEVKLMIARILESEKICDSQ